MPIDPLKFTAPYLPQQQCWQEADLFRQKYWPSGALPVDVMAIAEFDVGLSIRLIGGLKKDADVDAMLLMGSNTLIVDLNQYKGHSHINRLRFSVAHELGHHVLHRGVFAAAQFSTPKEMVDFMVKIPEKQYSFLELHANEFAGRLLVPKSELEVEFERALEKTLEAGLPLKNITTQRLSYLCKPIAANFQVSSEVIEKRLCREGLWPL